MTTSLYEAPLRFWRLSLTLFALRLTVPVYLRFSPQKGQKQSSRPPDPPSATRATHEFERAHHSNLMSLMHA
jgi:hypothetical protein